MDGSTKWQYQMALPNGSTKASWSSLTHGSPIESPMIDMLSVLSTPCTKPTRCHSATSRPVRSHTSRHHAACAPGLPARGEASRPGQLGAGWACSQARFPGLFNLSKPLQLCSSPSRPPAAHALCLLPRQYPGFQYHTLEVRVVVLDYVIRQLIDQRGLALAARGGQLEGAKADEAAGGAGRRAAGNFLKIS